MKLTLIILFLTTTSLYSKWEYFDYEKDSLLFYNDNRNNYIAKNGDIWMRRGYEIKKYSKNKLHTFYTNYSLPLFLINCISEDNNGNIWFGASFEKNIYNHILYKVENDKIIPINLWQNSWFALEDIKGIHFDEFNDPWVVTNKGIYCYKNYRWSRNVIDTLDAKFDIGLDYLFDNKVGETFNYNNHILVAVYHYFSAQPFYNFKIQNNKLSVDTIKNLKDFNSSFVNIDSSYNVCEYIPDIGISYYSENEWKKLNLDDSSLTFKLALIDEDGYYHLMKIIEKNEKINEYNFYKYKNDKLIFLFDTKYLQNDFENSINENEILISELFFKDKSGNYWFSLNNKGIAKYTPENNSVKKENEVNLYPNPTKDMININSKDIITELSLYSLNLSKILDFKSNNSTSQEIDVSNLPIGVYFLKVNDDFYKFVKE